MIFIEMASTWYYIECIIEISCYQYYIRLHNVKIDNGIVLFIQIIDSYELA